ncbi:MAG: chromate transporter [Acetobacteraceae bacterium]|nr:chromate transporter [Acetobacteraceae bacterium]
MSGGVDEAPGKPVPLRDLALTFNRIALASFGGGLSAWSREMVVRERHWMTDAEFLSAMTVCRVFPGANQVNVAVFVGTRLRGLAGAVAATAGLIAVPLVIVLVLGTLYLRFRDVAALRHILSGVTAAAVAMTFSMAWHTGQKILVSLMPVLLCAATFLLAGVARVPLWQTLLVLGPVAFAWGWRREAAAG